MNPKQFKIILLILICLTTNFLFGQTDQFIEVSTNDTLIIHPSKIHYRISVVQEQAYGISPQKSLDLATINKIKSEVTDILKKHNFKFTESNLQGKYSISNSKNPYLPAKSIQVELENETQLLDLVSKLKDVQSISGNIGSLEFKENEKNEKVLIEKLVTKAKTKAKFIANSMDVRLGEIISFSERTRDIESIISQEINKDRTMGWTSYVDHSITKVLNISAKIKFEIKN